MGKNMRVIKWLMIMTVGLGGCVGMEVRKENLEKKKREKMKREKIEIVEVGYYDTPGYAYNVFVSGNYAYVADGRAGLSVIDISNPFSTQEVGYYDTPGPAKDVFVSGNYVYVANGKAGLRIIDISHPSSPQKVVIMIPRALQRMFLFLVTMHIWRSGG